MLVRDILCDHQLVTDFSLFCGIPNLTVTQWEWTDTLWNVSNLCLALSKLVFIFHIYTNFILSYSIIQTKNTGYSVDTNSKS